MKRVKHYGKPMSKYDIAYEIDRIQYSYIGLMLTTLTYEELRFKLFVVVNRFAPYRLCEFENLTAHN